MIIKKKSYSIVNPGLLFSLLCLLFLSSVILYSQDQQASKDVYVDDQGVMRWSLNDEEVMGFGVNYSVPFAHAYRSAKRMGVDVKKPLTMMFIILRDWDLTFIVYMYGIRKLAISMGI